MVDAREMLTGDVAHKEGLTSMARVDAIWGHPAFQALYAQLVDLERSWPFCQHQLPHLLDTARIMWIRNLELGCGLDREVVYATALLHDIGRPVQMIEGTPHARVGARLAAQILDSLPDGLGFSAGDRDAIARAIAAHGAPAPDAEPLARLLYQADKASRTCFACAMRNGCSWSDRKKNMTVAI